MNSSGTNVFIDAAWMTQGAVIGSANMVLVVAILHFEALRDTNEYVVLMGLALADSVNMLSNFAGGLCRLLFSTTGLIPARQCLLRPHFVVTLFSENLATGMLCVVAFDRVLFMLWPLQYMAKNVRYSRRLIGGTYLCYLSYGGVGVVRAFVANGPDHLLGSGCFPMQFLSNHALVGRFHSVFARATIPLPAILSVFMVLILWPIYRHRTQKLKANGNEMLQLKRQRSFTKSIALSTCCTLVLYIVPCLIALYSNSMGWKSVGLTCKFVFGFNALANVFIYQLRHLETRKAVNALFRCKQMPPNVDLWHQLGKGSNKPRRSKVHPIQRAI